jgi:hypothetical protein
MPDVVHDERAVLEHCVRRPWLLTRTEWGFLYDLMLQDGPFSAEDKARLGRIYTRLLGAAG